MRRLCRGSGTEGGAACFETKKKVMLSSRVTILLLNGTAGRMLRGVQDSVNDTSVSLRGRGFYSTENEKRIGSSFPLTQYGQVKVCGFVCDDVLNFLSLYTEALRCSRHA